MLSKWDIVREESTEKIIEAALGEFGEKGYTGATLKNIAQRAGVANGLVSKYFGSKENLLVSLFRGINLDSIFEELESNEPRDVLEYYIDYARRVRDLKPILFHFFATMINSSDVPEDVSEFWKEDFKGSRLEGAIKTAQKQGNLPKGKPFDIFRILFASTYLTLRRYEEVGIAPPDNSAILGIIRYQD